MYLLSSLFPALVPVQTMLIIGGSPVLNFQPDVDALLGRNNNNPNSNNSSLSPSSGMVRVSLLPSVIRQAYVIVRHR